MKSRKNVSRKKTARHKTSTRRSSGRRSIRNRNKSRRGGMLRSARKIAGTLLYHDILPLLSRARLNIQLGREPTPDEYAITKENDRYYGTILDIPADDGIKTSIEELRKELENPVKTADKIKSINEKYDTIMKKLEEERKKQLAKQSQGLMVVGKQFTSSPRLVLSAIDVGSSSTPTPSSNVSPKSTAISDLVKRPFTTPTRSDYSTKTTEPKNPDDKSKFKPKPAEQLDYGTPPRNPFDVNGPIDSPQFGSPPPLDQAAKKENQNPQLLLSLGPEVRKLRF